jgi:uncharacterized repeat protein (TIGR02543 family)
MKKLVLIIMAVLAFAGMSVAQDVYSAGYYEASNGKAAAVYKNGTKLHDVTPSSSSFYFESSAVYYYNGDVYWTKNRMNSSDDSYSYGDIMKNGSIYLNSDIGNGSHINALYHNGQYLYSCGCINFNDTKVAASWRGNNASPQHLLGNYSYPSEATCVINGDAAEGFLYFGGWQYTSETTYHGVIWKGGNEEYILPDNTRVYGIDYFDGDVYSVGYRYENSHYVVKVWKNSSELYSLTSSSDNGRGFGISVEAGDVYVSGWEGSTLKVWKNGTAIQNHSVSGTSNNRAVVANSQGVYYAGYLNGQGKVWKDGAVLYSPSNCTGIKGLFVDNSCQDSEVRELPYTEDFSTGTTDWACWNKVDQDLYCGGNGAFWHRKNSSGGISAVHNYSSSSTQTGWLISPPIFLQPGREATTLTFKTAEQYPSDFTQESVWLSTTGNTPSDFDYMLWSQTAANASYQWKNVSVNLNNYQGQVVYIAFKYSGLNGHNWYIDDINISDSWSPCSTQSVPYTYSFNNWNINSTCWYIVDFDMSGGEKHWKYNSSENCAYHPYGQPGVSQYGCLVSPNINLPSGHDYVLKFKTKSSSSGSGMSNKIYIKLDGTGVPNPSTYYTLLWNDTQFPSSWTDVEIPISSYAGHTISFSFEYEGTYAHNWYIKDMRVEEAIAQYNITVNANNSAWGSVTGGGPYNAGTNCTITATPASGYQFQSWKKNGTVVSTNLSYTFTVTENATYTAYFGEIPINYYTIDTEVNPANAGSVSGGGTFQEGSSITLTATANNGYEFDHWQDGNTQNPRTITVTQNATYTATFSQLEYTITVYANPTDGGNVSGDGTFHYGETATLTATPNTNYEFAGWNDGSNDNPHTVTVTGNASYTAIFNEVGATYYTVSTHVSPENAGTVAGGGTFEEGTVVVLTATANAGYTFSHWNDGVTSNPRTITVNNNMEFTATFSHNQYTISVVANPDSAGSVSGGGAYYYGDNATLYATAYSGYEFVGWSDGSTESPHTVTVTGNATYTATFSEIGTTYYNVSTYVSPTNAGTVTGAGTYPAGTTITVYAEADEGYTFVRWNDGVTTNPRTVTVNNNMSFTAYFSTNSYTITVNASPTEGGSVIGGGIYAYGETAMLHAMGGHGYNFLQWSDGNTDNPRTVVVTGDATYTALFMPISGTTYTVTVTSAQPELGSVLGGGTYAAGMSIQIAAYPNEGASFLRWDDGNTDNPRTVTVNGNLSFEAHFAANQTYTIEVFSANPEMGNAFGGGTFVEGTQIQISAVPFQGYIFTGWDDGNADNPRIVTVTSDAVYKAQFSENTLITHTVTLICNTAEGSVMGGGVYVHGSQAYLQAIPNQGFQFTKWSDENTDNPRIIEVTSDITLAAFFGVGVDENEQANIMVYPNPAKESIHILGIEANSEVTIYNALGELVKVTNANAGEEIGIKELAPGLYLVRCGNVTLRFVKMN